MNRGGEMKRTRGPVAALWRRGARSSRLCMLLLLLGACTTTRTYVAPTHTAGAEAAPPAGAVYRVFLAGDAGATVEDRPALRLLAAQLEAAGPNAAVVWLGDNAGPAGLPEAGTAGRAEAEARLQGLLRAVEGFEGRIVFIPGEKDWARGREGGLEALRRQEAYVEAALGRDNVFLPDDGFPGPVEVELADGLTLVVLDTQWWLTTGEKPFGETDAYDLEEEADVLLQLEDVVRRRDDEQLLVVGHHPLLSDGRHGGHFTLREHLFPATAWRPGAYVPLPLLGSAYPLYRKYVGTAQDLAHGRYHTLRHALTAPLSGLLARHERLVYAGAHDHSLQYFDRGDQHYLVSGAAAAAGYVARGREAAFAAARPGFLSLLYYADGTVWLEAWTAAADGTGDVAFRTRLFGPMPERVDAQVAEGDVPDYTDSVKVAAANPSYAAGPVKAFFLGRQHRAVWAQPVTVPYLGLGREAGGLTPVKRGGGMQTRSLRLRGGDGREYVLRSIDKDPSRTVPVKLQGTAADDLVQDGISAIHPYGAFIVPALADAAGVYHTNPRLVYVPDDPRLGVYRATFGGRLMMFEERPDEDMSDVPGYGGARDVVSPAKLYREIDGDNDHRVDQHAFARARLFDMLLSDWDRHRDQWRWAAFEPYELDPTLEGDARTQGKVYRPVPRDRDWAFNQMDGLFPSLLPYVIYKFQDFDEDYGYLPGLTLNGLEQDRRFTNAVTEAEWVAIAEDLRARLTDDAIAAAVRGWPEPVYRLHGEAIAATLAARRDQLPEVAARFYRLMARVVDVVGSNKHERFEVVRQPDGRTDVVVYRTDRDGEVRGLFYRRTFYPEETREVRLYGLDGEDRFIVEGEARAGIAVTIVGGPGEDVLVDRSRVAGPGRKTRFFDTEHGNEWVPGPETKVVASADPLVNRYDSRVYRHDVQAPLAFFGYNQDDGVFLGGGVRFVRYGFRKEPHARAQNVRANVAAATEAYNVRYDGHFTGVAGGWDLALSAAWLSPKNIRNFYGLGNETTNTVRDATYYQANLRRLSVAPALERRLGEGVRLRVGPFVEFTDVRFDPDRFVGQPQSGISPRSFDDQWFAGLRTGLDVDTRDDPVNPKQGFTWTSRADLYGALHDAGDPYARLASTLAVYVSPSLSPQVTLAVRAGGAHNVGAFPFYGASTLGGRDNLRGFRGTRFAGRTSLYQNVDLRVKLFDLRSYLVLGEAGLVGFFDNGRVWADGEASNAWHQGYGGGVWLTLFDTAAIVATVDNSVEEHTFTLKLGFLY